MTRTLIVVARTWTIYAHLAGMTVLSLVIGYGIVWAVSGNADVITARNVRYLDGTAPDPGVVPTLKAKVGGRYGYVYDLERHEICPGEVVITWTSHDLGAPAVVSVRKPSVLSAVREYVGVRIDNPLPDAVRPGFWTMQTVIVSRCANRERTDPVSAFELEVSA